MSVKVRDLLCYLLTIEPVYLHSCCETDAMFPAEKREAAVKACEKIAKDKGVFCK